MRSERPPGGRMTGVSPRDTGPRARRCRRLRDVPADGVRPSGEGEPPVPLWRPDRHDAQGRGRGAPRRQGLRPGRPSARRVRRRAPSGSCEPAPTPGARCPRHRRMAAMIRLTYPAPPTDDQVDDYHGTLIADPYRPLEDSDAPASREWIAAQNELTARVLDGVPARRAIRARLAEVWDYPRAGAPWRRGDRGSSSGTPASRTRTCSGRPTGPRARAGCSSTRTA